ncbi:MAG: succinate dehydrogenase cytochrome b subunit [Bdellovibrionaceae bacterium]|nr:succinate dehydrogenase cytochrome b subunit [Pseudobdellovibrionaceae bacterium]
MNYLKSSIGRKQLMGLTGLLWCGFVLSHMVGNMLIFMGPDAYNKYSHALITNPLLLLAEGALVVTLLVHIFYGLKLKFENQVARHTRYAMPTNGEKAARAHSKFMAFHGTLILVFIVYHLVTFKYGTHYVTNVDGVEMRDLHRLIIEVFQSPGYVAWYVLCLIGLGFHLSHGFYSAFASLGFYHPKYSAWLNQLGYVYAFVVAAGFISQPLYVFLFARAQ